MNARIEAHVAKYLKAKGEPDDRKSVIAEITSEREIWKGDPDKHRWWTVWSYVVEIDGMLIMYADATSDGDDSAKDRGYDFEPESICEAEAYTETITNYRVKKEAT